MADKLELDAQTGIAVERDFTPEELEQRKQDLAKQAEIAAAIAAQNKLKEETIAKLGLTIEELKALLS